MLALGLQIVNLLEKGAAKFTRIWNNISSTWVSTTGNWNS